MRFSSLTGIGLPRDQPFKNTEALPWRLGGTFQESISFTGNSKSNTLSRGCARSGDTGEPGREAECYLLTARCLISAVWRVCSLTKQPKPPQAGCCVPWSSALSLLQPGLGAGTVGAGAHSHTARRPQTCF